MNKLAEDKKNIISYRYIKFFDSFFNKILTVNALLIIVLLLAILVSLIIYSMPSIKIFGISFLYGKEWDPYFQRFGALPFIISTLITSFLALMISIPFTFAVALFLGEYYTEGKLPSILKIAIECLAGIPSVIYGFWGLLVLAPKIQLLEVKLGVEAYGVGLFTASLILSMMIIPYATSISREVISLVPADLKEAGYSLGATRLEVVLKIIFPYVRSGIFAGILLSLGRALGETMAVTMVIGNSNFIPKNIFSPANTMASVIANEFAEATGELYLASIIYIGLWLFVVTMIINIIGKIIVNKVGMNR